MGSSILNTIIYVVLALGSVGIIAFVWWRIKNWNAYNIEVRIYSKRKAGYKTWNDWGAFKKNKKTGDIEGFRLKDGKITLQCPNYESLMPSPKGNVIHLLQMANDEYFALDPTIDDFNGSTNGLLKLKVIESDIQLWAITAMDRNNFLYSKPGWFDKYGMYVIFAVVAFIILIMIYLVLQKFSLLKEVADSFKDSVAMMKEMRSSSVVLPSEAPPLA
jgi:hypothetical protein